MCETFSKRERILKPLEYGRVYKQGRRVSTNYVRLFFLKGERRRLGIAVGKGIGKAVERNRLKRWIREFFRLNKEGFPLGDVVFHVRGGAGSLAGKEFKDELEKCIERIGR